MVQERIFLKCPLCESTVSKAGVECSSTHPPVLNSWVWDSTDSLRDWYRSPDYHHAQYLENRGRTCSELYGESRKAAIERLRFLEPFRMCSSPRLMDMGCGNNAFVDEANYQGYHAFGMDPHPLGTALKGEWKDLTQKFGFICSHDVIEHLTDPLDFLLHMKSCLSEGGILVIETPEYLSEGWQKHNKEKEHLTLYSREGAEALYEKAGLSTILFYRPLRGKLSKMAHILQRL